MKAEYIEIARNLSPEMGIDKKYEEISNKLLTKIWNVVYVRFRNSKKCGKRR